VLPFPQAAGEELASPFLVLQNNEADYEDLVEAQLEDVADDRESIDLVEVRPDLLQKGDEEEPAREEDVELVPGDDPPVLLADQLRDVVLEVVDRVEVDDQLRDDEEVVFDLVPDRGLCEDLSEVVDEAALDMEKPPDIVVHREKEEHESGCEGVDLPQVDVFFEGVRDSLDDHVDEHERVSDLVEVDQLVHPEDALAGVVVGRSQKLRVLDDV
jgi:hypothetical protein